MHRRADSAISRRWGFLLIDMLIRHMRKGAAEVAMGLVVRGIELCSNLGFGDERT